MEKTTIVTDWGLVLFWVRHDAMINNVREGKLPELHRINQLPVVMNDKLVGIVTDRDLRDAFPSVFEAASDAAKNRENHVHPEKVTVESLMSANLITVSPDDTMSTAARLLLDERIGALPVVETGKLVGIVARSDVLGAYLALADEG